MKTQKINIINFVRGCEPRYETDLYEPLREELALCKKYGFDNTVLLQYDAMLRNDIMALVKGETDGRTEVGVWIEIVRPLCEACGLQWRGRDGWDWDWHIVPGFLMAYTQSERMALCDEIMRLFFEKFGYYPRSVGSWLLDGFSMGYMTEKHGVKAYCVCRDQDNTDAYTLWGGYFNGGYYPSKVNMLSAAVDMKNAIKTPTFRMLCPDPIYNYLNTVRPKRFERGPYTLEPTWKCGQLPDVISWYFKWFCDERCLSLSYMQIGQENSFPWSTVKDGLEEQLRQLDELRRNGKVSVEKLGDTGEAFMREYPENVPEALTALDDWDGNNCKSVWYMSKYYRANLFFEDGKLYFRDIHKFDDDYRERYYDDVCTTNPAIYDTLPVCDGWNLHDEKASGTMNIGDGFYDLKVEKRDGGLTVDADGPRDVKITFSEGKICVHGSALSLDAKAEFADNISVVGNAVKMIHRGFEYEMKFAGRLEKTPRGYDILPIGGKVELVFGQNKNPRRKHRFLLTK